MGGEPAYRRGSVQASPEELTLCGHLSVRSTWRLQPFGCGTGSPYLTFDLAPDGVYPATTVTCGTGALLPHRFTLTCAPGGAIGGLLSVALACVSPRLAVSQHHALRSPDLPQLGCPSRDHPADSPSTSVPWKRQHFRPRSPSAKVRPTLILDSVQNRDLNGR